VRKKYGERFEYEQEQSYKALVERDDIDGVLLVVPNNIHAEQLSWPPSMQSTSS
jgi:predicted dehydrogenase